MKKTTKVAVISTAVTMLPLLSLADGLDGLLTKALGWMQQLSLLLIAAATLAFFFGLVKFIWKAEDKEQSKSIMVWGIIALFIMFSIWAIIGWLQTTLGTTNTVAPNTPDIPGLQR